MSSSPTTREADAELVRRFVAGDESAFHAIVEDYQPYLFSIAQKFLNNPHDAEEVVQDAFIRAHRKLRDFRGDSSLKTWLTTVVMNLARNRYWYFYRRRRHLTISVDHPVGESSDETYADLIACNRASPRSEAVTAEFTALIARAMQRMTHQQREIITLRAVLNRSYDEIAAALGLNVGTVKSRLARARMLLLSRIRESRPDLGPDVTPLDFLEPLRPPDSELRRA